MDYLPNVSGVRYDLPEQIEVNFSGVKREPKSINVFAFDAHSIAWIEFCEKDSPMARFVQEYNYKRYRGNVLTVSVVELGRVVGGHVDRTVTVDFPPCCSRTSTPSRFAIVARFPHETTCCKRWCQI